MTDNVFKTKKFKLLQTKWYKKLADAGFEDIERDENTLKASTDIRTVRQAYIDQEERQTYYSIAKEFLNSHRFKTEEEREIWRLHCEGIGQLTIARQFDMTYYRVNFIISELKRLAKLARKKND